jgi:hypothetical protein
MEAYEAEMERRVRESGKVATGIHLGMKGSSADGSNPQSSVRTALSEEVSGEASLFPAILVSESPERYRAFVSVLSQDGAIHSCGYADEERFEESWYGRSEGGILLQKVRRKRADALDQCLTKAWHEACSHLDGCRRLVASPNGDNGISPEGDLPRLLLNLLGLPGLAHGNGHPLVDQSNGDRIVLTAADASPSDTEGNS